MTSVAPCPCGDPGSPYYSRSSKPYGPSLCHPCWEAAALDPARRPAGTDAARQPQTPAAPPAAPERGELLDWGSTSKTKGKTGPPAPCVICAMQAVVRGPNGNPVHKTCAEAHPEQYRLWMSPSTVVAHVRDSRRQSGESAP